MERACRKLSILTVQIEYTEETRSNTNESIPLTLPLFQPFPLQLRFDRGQEIFAHGAENDESDVEANLDVGFDENDFTTNVKEQHLDKLGVIRGREQIVRRRTS